jgi:transaldolase
MLDSGQLAKLMKEDAVTGVTSNPTIFQKALSEGTRYDEQMKELFGSDDDLTDLFYKLAETDVSNACDLMADVWDNGAGLRGYVSIEVDPTLAYDTEATYDQAKELHEAIDKPNLYVKIPATRPGLPAIEDMIAAGKSINVTLIFSLQRYREVINAYLTGLERAKEAGIDLSGIQSVASFFVSRVDTEIDKRLTAIGTDEALALKSKAGLANARLAYQVYEEAFASERAKTLVAAGANEQRPLWASTGVKDPSLPDTLYVTELVAPNTVNTMPEKTLDATFDHGVITGDTVTGSYAESNEVLDKLAALGVDYDDVTATLEREGVEKFNVSWGELVETVTNALEGAKSEAAAK